MRGTDGRTDGRANGRTDERYGQIRSGTVGGPSRLASIHSPPNSLDLGIFFSSRILSSSHRSGSSLPRFPSTSRFQHPPHLPVSLNFSPASLRHSLAPFPLLFFSSPSFHRIFVASFSLHHSLAVIFHHLSAIPFYRPSLRCWTGTRNSSSLLTHDSTILEYASSRYLQPRHYPTNVYTCAKLFRVGVVRSLQAMRWNRQRVGVLCTVEY